MSKYSIIIPVHNEKGCIPRLLKSLEYYSHNGHEIIIIDDGSHDGSTELLEECNFINLIRFSINQGKGSALRAGLLRARNVKIIIFDSDLELEPSEIVKLMILDKKNNIYSAFGYRFKSLNPFKSSFDWGNFMFTSFFNIIFNSNHKDILCCAKSFYFDKKGITMLNSNKFEIDIELSSMLTMRDMKIRQILLKYNRRTKEEGKKLKINDGWKILGKMISMIKFY